MIPQIVENIIQERNRSASVINFMELFQDLGKARATLKDESEDVRLMAWSEVLAFALQTGRARRGPWGCYFHPLMTSEREDGTIVYTPDIRDASANFLDHYSNRARTLTHPMLRARYADLVWELAPLLDKAKRHIEMAHIAIDAYLSSTDPGLGAEHHDCLEWSIRAFDLASAVRDKVRRDTARTRLLALQEEAVGGGKGMWWLAFDRLVHDRKSELTDDQENALISGLEGLLTNYSNVENRESFDAHRAQSVAEHLLRYYRRKNRNDDVVRLHEIVARSFEHRAAVDDSAMRAGIFLQTAVNAYSDAGRTEDSARVRKLMEQKIAASREEMTLITTSIEIKREDVEKFCDGIIVDDLGLSFAEIAKNFMTEEVEIVAAIQRQAAESPLSAMMPQQLIADNRVAGALGSTDEDKLGRAIHQATTEYHIGAFWMHHAMQRLFERHDPPPEAFVAWANRSGIFEDVTFLLAGVKAWQAGDWPKALHLLVPQIEYALRKVAVSLGRPETKAHPSVPNTSVVISMGDILYNKEMQDQMGPNLTLYFLSYYADPRGFNLRNELAHGLLKPEHVNGHIVNLTIHTLLVFGLWREIVARDCARK